MRRNGGIKCACCQTDEQQQQQQEWQHIAYNVFGINKWKSEQREKRRRERAQWRERWSAKSVARKRTWDGRKWVGPSVKQWQKQKKTEHGKSDDLYWIAFNFNFSNNTSKCVRASTNIIFEHINRCRLFDMNCTHHVFFSLYLSLSLSLSVAPPPPLLSMCLKYILLFIYDELGLAQPVTHISLTQTNKNNGLNL